MKIGYLQYDVARDKEKNYRLIEKEIAKKEFDLVVLPELSVCGYTFADKAALEKAAEKVPEGRTVAEMLRISEKYNCIIVFGLAELSQGKVYNTAVVADKGRYAGKYRKIHLSDYEKRLFERGRDNSIIVAGGLKIGVQICFDLWFPEISREQLSQGAELFCVPANFGSATTCAVARVRAIENLTPLVMCNRTGSENDAGMKAVFFGTSSVTDSDGKVLSKGKRYFKHADCVSVDTGRPLSNVICADFRQEIDIHNSK